MANIIKEQGGSVVTFDDVSTQRFLSGASLIVDSGASLHSFGNIQAETGTCLTVNDGASLIIKPSATTGSTAYPIMNVGNNQVWYSPGSGGSPITTASPGDLMWVANSASTAIWVNISDGTMGSKWLHWGYGAGSNLAGGV
jgi:hypothetical protein